MKKKVSTRLFSIFLSLLMVVTILPAGTIAASAADSKIEDAINWAIGIANNNYYGYHYGARHGNHRCSDSWCNNEDFDCSSFVATALQKSGINVSMFSTNNMQTFIKNGFTYIAGTSNLQRGDILWRNGHVGIYLGNNQVVHAMYNYNNAKGGNGGGQYRYGTWRTGEDEIRVDTLNWFGSITGAYRYAYKNETAKPSVPVAPAINSISSENIAIGKSITINWNVVSGADNYTIGIRSAHVNQDINVGNATSYSYTLSYAEKYSFYVKASNVSGTGNWSSSKSCTAHNPVTVSFVDWDNTPLGSQTIDYGSNATAPSAPQRKGYTFQSWNNSFYNVTSDKTIKAVYKINTYTVNFFDKDGALLSSQKVDYGHDATPPKDTHENSKYVFLGWNSTDYINVYTDRADKNINIDGVYSWYNYDLPTVCTIKSATRQYDGYYVTFDIENNDSLPTTGRAVVALKTAEGKLVDMTESTAFSIPAGKTKSGVDVFIPCNKVASSIEVFMVADYSSGVPISPSVNTKIKEGLMYAESTVKPNNSDGTLDIQTVTQYSYRDKEFSTGNTKTKEGYTWDGTRNETLVKQTGYQDAVLSTYDNEFEKRVLLGTQSVPVYGSTWGYVYYHFHKPGGGSHTYCPTNHAGGSYHGYYYSTTPFTWSKKSSCGNRDMYSGPKCDQCGASAYWWYNAGDSKTITVQTGTKTQYNYATYQYTYNFYRWKTWSDWSDTQVSSNNNRDVRTRTVYRYAGNKVLPEDTSGKERTITGKTDSSFAGKQITLYVYGYTGASDYTNQYIGQSVIANDGSYSFTFKLREEPTAKTGDFAVAIGIEGTTNTTIIDTIKAPKPTYKVKFYDWDGSVISTQTVKEGENAVLPENPTKEGYNFVGWDKSVSNIREDTEFFADFERKQYTVVFVDWEKQQIEVKQFKHGDALVAPEVEVVDGYTFVGWDNENEIVTHDMIVTAQYEADEYTIQFYDWNNKVIDSQTVEYGKTAVVPDDPSGKGINFVDWLNSEDYQYVTHDAAIYPVYYYDETTDMPTANYHTGEYNDKIQLELSSDDKNAEIHYYFDGDETSDQIYTNPITIDKTCSVTYYAVSDGKNDSETATEYYCINTNDNKNYHLVYINPYVTISDTVLFVEDGKTIDTKELDNIEGYDLKGLYTDEKLTTKFNTSTPIKKSITLFTKYSPKKYIVTFQMEDGTKLDVQTVEYMQPATAPDVDSVPGYVFGGWDKALDCITEDTVVTGKYIKEADHINTEVRNKKSATCTANGYTGDTYCKDCGLLLKSGKTISATGHSYDAGKVTKAPTATTAGVKTYTCTKCKATKTETIKATGLKTPVLKAAVNANGTIKLSWGKVAEAEKYELYIKQSDGSYKLLKTTTGTSFTTGTAAYGKQYTYKMRAVKGNIKSAYSAAVNAKNTKKLQTPTAKAMVNANGSFTLSWNKVAGATRYGIYMLGADGKYSWIKSTSATSWTTGTAQYGKKYTYKVFAVNDSNKSANSSFSSAFSATNNKKLQSPSAKVTVNANGSFKLSWNKVTGATKYGIYMKQTNGSYKWIKTVTGTSWTTAAAQYGKQYSYKILAANNNKSAQTFSNVVNAKNTKKLTTPTLKVAVNKNGSFKLTWGKVTGATSYQIYMKQANGSYKLIKTTSSTSFTTAVAAKGKTYSYKVRAVTGKNKNATSNYSNVVNAKRK